MSFIRGVNYGELNLYTVTCICSWDICNVLIERLSVIEGVC